MSPIFNFHFIDGTTVATVAFILMAGGGGTFAVVRRNRQHARQADPEAIELHLNHVVERRAAPSSADDVGVQENTVVAQDTGARGQGGAVEGSITLNMDASI